MTTFNTLTSLTHQNCKLQDMRVKITECFAIGVEFQKIDRIKLELYNKALHPRVTICCILKTKYQSIRVYTRRRGMSEQNKLIKV